MKLTDYPSLYISANNASLRTQKYYLNAFKIYLLLLICSALLTQFAPKVVLWSIVTTIILLITLSLSIYQAFKRFDKIWYNGRAVAESVKTRTWRFIMCAEPYEANDLRSVKKKFIEDINEILNENKGLGQYLNYDCDTNCITDAMLSIRSTELLSRIEYYKINRIDEQRTWYSQKSKANKKQSIIWFSVMILANTLAIIFAILLIVNPKNNSLPIESLIVIAGGALSWMQVKKFQDLSTSYNLAAHEITIIRQKSEFIDGEDDFSDFVKDAENAFSREHTQWAARKDT